MSNSRKTLLEQIKQRSLTVLKMNEKEIVANYQIFKRYGKIKQQKLKRMNAVHHLNIPEIILNAENLFPKKYSISTRVAKKLN